MEVVGGEDLKRFFMMQYDRIFIPVGILMFAFVLALVIFALVKSDLTLAAGGGIMLLMGACLSWPNRYSLDNQKLRWHNGLVVNKHVKLTDIVKIRPGEAKNGITVRKVQGHWLHVGKKELFVSAENHQDLMKLLLESCTHLRPFGHEYRRVVE